MKKSIFWLVAIILLITYICTWAAEPPKKSAAPKIGHDEWKIDDELKFHYAYIKQDALFPDGAVKYERPGIPSFSKPGAPDITNIILKNILALGFPLPARKRPEDFKFFLKFYKFPSSLDPEVTAERVVTPFLLYNMKGARRIYMYIKNRNNVYVKEGFIAPKETVYSKDKPCPAFRIPRAPIKDGKVIISPQSIFDASIPFCSIYITNKGKMPPDLSEKEKAEWTTRGLLSFYNELLCVYNRNCIRVTGMEQDKYYYFIHRSYKLHKVNEPYEIVVIKYPKKPLLFVDNFRNLPMPHDPKRIFLSGLLIVYKSRYVGKNPRDRFYDMVIDSPEFNKNYKVLDSDLLEVVSAVKI